MTKRVQRTLAEVAPSHHPKAVVPALDAETHRPCRSTDLTSGATAPQRAPMDPGGKPRDDIGGGMSMTLDNPRGDHA